MDYHQCRCWSILYNSHKQNKKQIRELLLNRQVHLKPKTTHTMWSEAT